jgi:hypothetical protein
VEKKRNQKNNKNEEKNTRMKKKRKIKKKEKKQQTYRLLLRIFFIDNIKEGTRENRGTLAHSSFCKSISTRPPKRPHIDLWGAPEPKIHPRRGSQN